MFKTCLKHGLQEHIEILAVPKCQGFGNEKHFKETWVVSHIKELLNIYCKKDLL